MNPETWLQNHIRVSLEAPDGACFLIEVKRPGRPHPLSKVQALTLVRWGKIARAGVAETVDEALQIMEGGTT